MVIISCFPKAVYDKDATFFPQVRPLGAKGSISRMSRWPIGVSRWPIGASGWSLSVSVWPLGASGWPLSVSEWPLKASVWATLEASVWPFRVSG